MAGADQIKNYDKVNVFPVGSVWHAAETGCLTEMKEAEAAGQARGYPPSVTLQLKDDILQCQPLHVAAEKGRLGIVQYLMTQKVDLDSGDAHMVRPLHLAAITNHIDIVQQLIDRGANPTKQDEEGDVPLHWAATKGHVEMLQVLLDRGSSVDGANRHGWTALHRAAFTGHETACQLLLQRGASVNALTRDGRTALHLAALQNHLGVLELLLGLGAALHLKDDQGNLAAALCISDAAKQLFQTKAAKNSGVPSKTSRPSSSMTAATSSNPATSTRAATVISHVPEMPRYRSQNTNLDADGFPLAIQEAIDLQSAASADSPSAETSLVQQLEAEAAEQLQQEQIAMVQDVQPSIDISSCSLSYAGGRLQRRPERMSSLSSSGGISVYGAAAQGVAGSQELHLQSSPSLQKQASSGRNKKFLKQYGLHRMGLFAP